MFFCTIIPAANKQTSKKSKRNDAFFLCDFHTFKNHLVGQIASSQPVLLSQFDWHILGSSTNILDVLISENIWYAVYYIDLRD